MADEEDAHSANDEEALNGDNGEEAQSRTNIDEASVLELKEMLIDIQITVSNILRENSKLTNEVAELRNAFQQQKTELTTVRLHWPKQWNNMMTWKPNWLPPEKKKNNNDQEEEIAELYDLQDELEQYTRKNSLEIHGVPQPT